MKIENLFFFFLDKKNQSAHKSLFSLRASWRLVDEIQINRSAKSRERTVGRGDCGWTRASDRTVRYEVIRPTGAVSAMVRSFCYREELVVARAPTEKRKKANKHKKEKPKRREKSVERGGGQWREKYGGKEEEKQIRRNSRLLANAGTADLERRYSSLSVCLYCTDCDFFFSFPLFLPLRLPSVCRACSQPKH